MRLPAPRLRSLTKRQCAHGKWVCRDVLEHVRREHGPCLRSARPAQPFLTSRASPQPLLHVGAHRRLACTHWSCTGARWRRGTCLRARRRSSIMWKHRQVRCAARASPWAVAALARRRARRRAAAAARDRAREAMLRLRWRRGSRLRHGLGRRRSWAGRGQADGGRRGLQGAAHGLAKMGWGRSAFY